MPDFSPAFRQALAHLSAGRAAEAEAEVTAAATRAEAAYGPDAPPTRDALHDLGVVLLELGRSARAAVAFGRSCDGPPPAEPDALRARLSAELNWARALAESGDSEAAEAVLRDNLARRAALYGTEHPGHGVGLQALAELLHDTNRPDDALVAAQEAVRAFWKAGHEGVAAALALHAEILLTSRPDLSAFQGTEPLPPELVRRMAECLFRSAEERQTPAVLGCLDQLASLLESRLGPADEATVAAGAHLANVAGALGRHAERVAAVRRTVDAYDRAGRTEAAFRATLGLALALADAGDADGAIHAYSDAVARSAELGDAARSQAYRNLGLLLRDTGHLGEAEAYLTHAVAHAERAGDPGPLSQARIALGTVLQQLGRGDEARPWLEAGLSGLERSHPDALSARMYLDAIASGGGLRHDAMARSLCDAFREDALERLPPELVAGLEVTLEAGTFRAAVDVTREPSPDEVETVERVIEDVKRRFERVLAGA